VRACGDVTHVADLFGLDVLGRRIWSFCYKMPRRKEIQTHRLTQVFELRWKWLGYGLSLLQPILSKEGQGRRRAKLC
jgi:hypothetical protein